MKIFKKLTSLSLIVVLSLFIAPISDSLAKGQSSNRCAIPMHASTESVKGYLYNGTGSKHFVVEPGGHLESGGGGLTVFLEAGSKMSNGGGGGHTIYAKKGSVIENIGGGAHTIYYEDEASLVNIGNTNKLIKCGILVTFRPEYQGPNHCVLPIAKPYETVDMTISNDESATQEEVELFYKATGDREDIIVKKGGSVSTHHSIDRLYVEEGGEINSRGRMSIFVKKGGTLDADNWGSHIIYHEPGALLNNIGKNNKTVACDFIHFYPSN